MIKNTVRPSEKIVRTSKNPAIAPPVLNIPFEATNTSSIHIKGYSVPNAKVEIYVDEELSQEAETTEDGSFLADQVTLTLGTNNIAGKRFFGIFTQTCHKSMGIIYN